MLEPALGGGADDAQQQSGGQPSQSTGVLRHSVCRISTARLPRPSAMAGRRRPLAGATARPAARHDRIARMGWNYRVVRDGDQVAIHEVFYSETGEVIGVTEKPVYPRAETIDGLTEELTRYGAALHASVLDYHEIAEAAEQSEAQPESRQNDVRVYFAAFGTWERPETISAIIGREPTSFRAINSPISRNSTALTRKSIWKIESGLPRSASVEDQLTALLKLLRPYERGVRQVAEQYSAAILCAAYWKTFTPGVHLTFEQIHDLATLRLSFDLDMYYLE